MELAKCFIVFVVLIGRTCYSKIMIEVKQPDRADKLEEAQRKILTNCYANHDNAIVFLGDFPENVYKNLSSHRLYSLILINDKKRAVHLSEDFDEKDLANGIRKINVVVVAASYYIRTLHLINRYMRSRFYNATTAYLVLGWSFENKHAMCDGKRRTFKSMVHFNPSMIPNLKMMCLHRTKGIMMYNSNFYTNQIPEPWKVIVTSKHSKGGPDFYMLGQQYQEHEEMCKNLDFDKTHDLGGTPIQIIFLQGVKVFDNRENEGARDKSQPQRWLDVGLKKKFYRFSTFFKYVNASVQVVKERITLGNSFKSNNWKALEFRSTMFKGTYASNRPYAYPFQMECQKFLTQFRGNKSQLRKIVDVIDINSWISIFIVYVITFGFFKFFLREPIVIAILNLFRLTSNLGLTTLPVEMSSQIYLSCLFICVVTMQGIFVSNLASLLTMDVPVRQVDSLQDIIDLGYTTYVDDIDLKYFDHPALKGRIITKIQDIDCIPIVQSDPLVACVFWGIAEIEYASFLKLYISPKCFANDYYTNFIPLYWTLEQRYNEIMSIMFATGTLGPFDAMVNEKRLIDFQSLEVQPEPRVMTFGDLTFAFIILGVGLSIALVTFIGEILIYRFQHRVTSTRVIAIN